MRTLVEVELDTETSNQRIADGTMPKLMESFLGSLKPEASYFFPRNGRRCALFVVDVADEATLVSVVEPFWTDLRASVTTTPCMNADDLGAGLGRYLAG